MSFKLGLTGSIGMGKSTTAGFFADAGVPVWDADATVVGLYGKGGQGVVAIRALVPGAVVEGLVDRPLLRQAISQDSTLLDRIEAVIHPLVGQSRTDFIAANAGNPLVLFDIPLLYETGADQWLDAVLVVTAPPDIQKSRVLERGTMTLAQFESILERQTPDAEKRQKADYVIDTANGLESARNDVLALITKLGA